MAVSQIAFCFLIVYNCVAYGLSNTDQRIKERKVRGSRDEKIKSAL